MTIASFIGVSQPLLKPREGIGLSLEIELMAAVFDDALEVAGGAGFRIARGEFRVNPLYDIERDGGRTRLRLRFPSPDYEEEYGAARLYLHDEIPVDAGTLASLPANRLPAGLADLARRRIILDLPKQWW